jgi:hypothetical protein
VFDKAERAIQCVGVRAKLVLLKVTLKRGENGARVGDQAALDPSTSGGLNSPPPSAVTLVPFGALTSTLILPVPSTGYKPPAAEPAIAEQSAFMSRCLKSPEGKFAIGGLAILALWTFVALPLIYAPRSGKTALPGPCDSLFLGMCLIVPPEDSVRIFGFAEFVQAFALLVLIFTLSDVRYRFRVNTAPISFQGIGYWLVALVGLATLLTDFWFSNRYPAPWFLASHAWWQLVLGALFLLLVLMWLWYSYVKPPVFGRFNAFNFTRTVYRYLLQGNEADLPIVATELARSAPSIVRFAREQPLFGDPEPANIKTTTAAKFANDLLLIIAIRKFCRHIVASSPGTAIAFFQAMSDQQKYRIPIRQFGSNISTEALINKDSLLYHEDAGFYSGYFGYIRPFTNAIYGDYHLVEALSEGNSPLDIDLKVRQALDAQQLRAPPRPDGRPAFALRCAVRYCSGMKHPPAGVSPPKIPYLVHLAGRYTSSVPALVRR